MKNLIFILSLIGLGTLLLSISENINKELNGTWNFVAEDAPAPYRSGIIEFVESDGKVTGKMLSGNTTLPMTNLVISNDSITYELNIRSTVLTALLIKQNDSLKGKVFTPEGEMQITAKKQSKK